MSPSSSTKNIVNGLSVAFEAQGPCNTCSRFTAGLARFYLFGYCLCQNCSWILSAPCKFFRVNPRRIIIPNSIPSLLFSIGRIRQIISNKKMVYLDASRGIAVMANHFPEWYASFANKISCARRYFVFSLKPKSAVTSTSDFCLFTNVSSPHPTFSKLRSMFWDRPILVDLAPKTRNIFFSHKQDGSLSPILT